MNDWTTWGLIVSVLGVVGVTCKAWWRKRKTSDVARLYLGSENEGGIY